MAVALVYPYLTRAPAAAMATATPSVALASPALSTPTSFLDIMSTNTARQPTAQAVNVRLTLSAVVPKKLVPAKRVAGLL